MAEGRVRAVHVAPTSGAPVERREPVAAVADRGLEGDRYFRDQGTFEGSDLTLVERETLRGVARDYDIAIEPGAHRRNVTTEGVALNHLVGERFRVGSAVCVGERLCEPCSYLERLLEQRGVREALVHRGGLRARIVESGDVGIGDRIEPITSE